MSTKLHQIIAVEKSLKAKTHADLTEAHHALQKSNLLSGIARAYTPKDDDGEKLPAESTRVQVRVDDILKATAEVLTKLFDVTATKDYANCHAFANVQIGDKILLEKVPVTYLLFLDKQLVDMYTFVQKLPILDPSEKWTHDANQNAFANEPSETTKTKKIMRNHEKSPATDRHPAQVETYHEDVIVGTWKSQKFSGAIPATRHKQLLDRVMDLQRAVKYAREHANSADAPEIKTGKIVFDYLFA